MNPHTHRRRFLAQVGGAGLGLAVGGPLLAAPAESRLYQIGLSQYSLRQMFQSGELNVFDYPAFAQRTFGIGLIDVWEGGFPEDRRNDPDFYRELKKRADAAGSTIFLLMAGAVDARGETAELRLSQAKSLFPSLDYAELLGCRFVRIFVKAPAVDARSAAVRSAEALAPLAEYARKKNLVLAIEPGASELSRQGTWLVDLMKTLNHAHCRLMPDFGKLAAEQVYQDVQAMMPFTVVISAKSHDFDQQGNETAFDYYRLMKIVVDAGFRGIAAIEYEGKQLAPVDGVKATQKLLQQVHDRLRQA